MARRPVAAWASRKAVVARTRSCRPVWRESFARTQREQRARTRARQSSGQTFEQSFPSRRTRQRAESSSGREVIADEIPMPRRSAYARAWILERFVLKVGCRQADAAAVLEQALTVGRHQVRHWTTLPHVPVQPQPAIHGEDHPGTAVHEFAIGTILSFGTSSSRGIGHARSPTEAQLQVMRPSSVDGATGVAVPKYTVHFSAPSDRCVALADQPPAVASGTTTVTPADER